MSFLSWANCSAEIALPVRGGALTPPLTEAPRCGAVEQGPRVDVCTDPTNVNGTTERVRTPRRTRGGQAIGAWRTGSVRAANSAGRTARAWPDRHSSHRTCARAVAGP